MAQRQEQQQSRQSQDTSVKWQRQHHFVYPHGRDAVGVSMNVGKCLVLPTTTGNSQGSTRAQLYEWNLRRSFPFPSPQQARFAGGMAVNWNDEYLWVFGGADDNGYVLSSVEQFVLLRGQNPDWKWISDPNLPTPRAYGTAVAIPSEHVILVLGGRDGSWHEMDSILVGKVMESQGSASITEWITLESKPMPGPRMGCAAILLDETNLLVFGGYDGRSWQRTCFLYSWPIENLDQGTWKELPEMLETIQFVKAIRYYKYVLIVGEKEDLTAPATSSITCVQCFDTQKREWVWSKSCSCPPMDFVTLQGPNLYGLSARSPIAVNDNQSEVATTTSGVYSCALSQLDHEMVHNALPLAVGTTATPDIEAPTIVAMEAVLVPDDTATNSNNSTSLSSNQNDGTIAAEPYTPEGPIKLRHVVKVKLSEKSYYTGQLRKKDGTYVPHGQGLLVWVDDDNKNTNDSNSNNQQQQQQASSSYYKGQFYNGYRHGLGEMYLRVEDKHYFGSFEYGSWDGVGSLKIRSRGFSFFGHFVAGEMTGKGRCSYRIKEDGQWKQKTYAGGFNKGKAHGKGVIADYMTGKIEKDEEFHEEDLFQVGAAAPKPVASTTSIDT